MFLRVVWYFLFMVICMPAFCALPHFKTEEDLMTHPQEFTKKQVITVEDMVWQVVSDTKVLSKYDMVLMNKDVTVDAQDRVIVLTRCLWHPLLKVPIGTKTREIAYAILKEHELLHPAISRVKRKWLHDTEETKKDIK